MIRGTKTFKCSECGKRFSAPDIEWMASRYSVPQPCPTCGSRRTYPCGLLGSGSKKEYEKIWETFCINKS